MFGFQSGFSVVIRTARILDEAHWIYDCVIRSET